jgi:ELWxxDGT repeat protein
MKAFIKCIVQFVLLLSAGLLHIGYAQPTLLADFTPGALSTHPREFISAPGHPFTYFVYGNGAIGKIEKTTGGVSPTPLVSGCETAARPRAGKVFYNNTGIGHPELFVASTDSGTLYSLSNSGTLQSIKNLRRASYTDTVSIEGMTVFNQKIFILVRSSKDTLSTQKYSWDLWVSDGTTMGTQHYANMFERLGALGPNLNFGTPMVEANGNLFLWGFTFEFGALNRRLFVTSGTLPFSLTMLEPKGDIFDEVPELVSFAGKAICKGEIIDSNTQSFIPIRSGFEPLFSDGTPAGTKVIDDLMLYNGSSNPFNFRVVGERLVFNAKLDHFHNSPLYSTDTFIFAAFSSNNAIKTISPENINYGPPPAKYISNIEGDDKVTLLSTVDDDGVQKLYNQKSSLIKITGISIASIKPEVVLSKSNQLSYFNAVDSSFGIQLFESDGALLNTRRVSLPATGSGCKNLFVKDDSLLYFSFTSSTNGAEIWVLPLQKQFEVSTLDICTRRKFAINTYNFNPNTGPIRIQVYVSDTLGLSTNKKKPALFDGHYNGSFYDPNNKIADTLFSQLPVGDYQIEAIINRYLPIGNKSNLEIVVKKGVAAPSSTDVNNPIYPISFPANISTSTTWFRDEDNDGFGNPLIDSITCSGQPLGYVINGFDCDDNDSTTVVFSWFKDADGDGFGAPSDSLLSCSQPQGFVFNKLDCDDTSSIINPNTHWYRDADNDGFGNTFIDSVSCKQPVGFVLAKHDCNDTNAAIVPFIWFADHDGDGFGNALSDSVSCLQPAGFVNNQLDCDDSTDSITFRRWFKDEDNDGFGNRNMDSMNCTQPDGYVSNSLDCDDNDETKFVNLQCNDKNRNTFNDVLDTNCMCKGNHFELVEGEYFFDTDPGIGGGISFTALKDTSVLLDMNIPTDSITPGFHSVGIRFKNNREVWSITEYRSFYVLIANEVDSLTKTIQQPKLIAVEYFIDTLSGIGQGIPIAILSDTINILIDNISTQFLSSGFHYLLITYLNDRGLWSMPETRMFFVQGGDSVSKRKLVKAEIFIDTTGSPGTGRAIMIVNDSIVDVSTFISVDSVEPGFHTLAIRFLDTDGFWSLGETRTFFVSKTNSTLFKTIVRTEYVIDSIVAPGLGTPLSFVADSIVTITNNITTDTLAKGFHTLMMRSLDNRGVWSLQESRMFHIQGPKRFSKKLVSGEFFMDKDPGLRNGRTLSFAPDSLIQDTFSLPLTPADSLGFHKLYIRLVDNLGVWSLFERGDSTIQIIPLLPVVQIIGDTILCQGDSVLLVAKPDGIPVRWLRNGIDIGNSNPHLKVGVSGFYRFVTGTDTSRMVTVTLNARPITGVISGNATANIDTIGSFSVPITTGSIYHWMIEGGVQSAGANTNSIQVSWTNFGVNGIVKVVEENANGCLGDTVMLSLGAVLPVKILYVSGKRNEDMAYINWSIASESQVQYYEVQHSLDHNRFEFAGRVKSQNAKTFFTYNYRESLLGEYKEAEVVYYRIKVVYTNGEMEFTNTVTLHHQSKNMGLMELFPNPTDNVFWMKNTSSQKATIILSDVNGKIIDQFEIGPNETVERGTTELTPGVYTVTSLYADDTETTKLVLTK